MKVYQGSTTGTRWSPNSNPSVHAVELEEGKGYGTTLCGREGEVFDKNNVEPFNPDDAWACGNCARSYRKREEAHRSGDLCYESQTERSE